MIVSPPSLRGAPRRDGLIARYEELRQQALGRPSCTPRGQGLALLLPYPSGIMRLLGEHGLDRVTVERAAEPPEQSCGGKYREIIPLR